VFERALFLNGVFEEVLSEIWSVQEDLPEQILFLQPYSAERIVELKRIPPTVDAPLQLFASTSEELGLVSFTGELVGWRDRRSMPTKVKTLIDRVIRELQPNEQKVYPEARGIECTNLLCVRRLRPIGERFPVTRLKLIRKGRTVAGARATAGGWYYVAPLSKTEPESGREENQ